MTNSIMIKGIEAANPVIQNLRKSVNENFAIRPLEKFPVSVPLASPAAGAAVESETNNKPLGKQRLLRTKLY